MSTNTVEDFLEHFGVKGMHWGVRKASSGGSSSSDAPKPSPLAGKSNKEAIGNRKAVKSNLRTLSDADLKEFISRLNNEKQLRGLVDADIAPGRAAAKKTISESGHRVAKTVLVASGLYVAAKLIDKHLSSGLAKSINSNAVKNVAKAAVS